MPRKDLSNMLPPLFAFKTLIHERHRSIWIKGVKEFSRG